MEHGQKPFVLFLILNENPKKNYLEEISGYIHDNITQYKWPERIIIKDLFPKNPIALEKAKEHSADFFIQICKKLYNR